MIARHEASGRVRSDGADIWSKLAAPLPTGVISWRQDGKPTHRDGKYFARFVCYIEANTVRERLDRVVPGEWDLTLELLPTLPGLDDDAQACSFKGRLQILGVIREDVGTGKDYKQAATDAFKRAAVRFGIGHELYAYEQNWVQVDGDGKYAKALEDPGTAYARRYGGGPTPKQQRAAAANGTGTGNGTAAPEAPTDPDSPDSTNGAANGTAPAASGDPLPSCPKCGGNMWDNRLTKRNPKAPNFKCRDRSCDGVIWPPKGATVGRGSRAASDDDGPEMDTSPLGGGDDDLPF